MSKLTPEKEELGVKHTGLGIFRKEKQKAPDKLSPEEFANQYIGAELDNGRRVVGILVHKPQLPYLADNSGSYYYIVEDERRTRGSCNEEWLASKTWAKFPPDPDLDWEKARLGTYHCDNVSIKKSKVETIDELIKEKLEAKTPSPTITQENPPEEQMLDIFETIRNATSHLAKPFGGYVRDKIAGQEPEDIDLFMTGDKSDTIATRLRRYGFDVIFQKSLPYAKGMRGWRYTVAKNGVEVQMDLVYPSLEYLDINNGGIDVDVNALYLDGDKVKCFVPGLEVEKIVKNIHAKVAIPQPNAQQHRLLKITKKGYTLLDKDFVIMNLEEAASAGPTKFSTTKPKQEKSLLRRTTERVAYRQTTKKISKGTRLLAGVAIVQAFGMDAEQAKTVKFMLDQPAGDSLLSLIIGLGLLKAPEIGETEIVRNLSEHFLVHSGDVAFDEGLNVLVKEFQDTVYPYLKKVVATIKAAQEGEYLEAMAELKDMEVPNLRVLLKDERDEYEGVSDEEALQEEEDFAAGSCVA